MTPELPDTHDSSHAQVPLALKSNEGLGAGDGAMSFCACMGPMYGEPHCYCTMVRRGLPLNQAAREEDAAKLTAALNKIFGLPGSKRHNVGANLTAEAGKDI